MSNLCDLTIGCDYNRFSDTMFTGLNKSACCGGPGTEDVFFFPLVHLYLLELIPEILYGQDSYFSPKSTRNQSFRGSDASFL